MQSDTFRHKADDGKELFVYRWTPDEGKARRGIVHIAHGMAEHGGRYVRVAEALTGAGYVVYADDHRGHGKTAVADDDLGYFTPKKGFQRVVQDIQELIAREKKENPGLGAVLVGHSMGSFMTQLFLIEYGAMLKGAVISGTAGKPAAVAQVGKVIARLEQLRLGERGKSSVLDKLSFGNYNDDFKPNRTKFDWLSRDPAEVDKYVADPRCGFLMTATFWIDFLDALDQIADPNNQARIPKELPIYIFAGDADPVGARTKSIQQLIGAYAKAGLRYVTYRFYPGGRHETLNEINRDEVTRDLLAWLDGVFPKHA